MKTNLERVIKTPEQADAFITELHKNDELFHFDDDVKEIFEGENPFILDKLESRVDELFSIEGYDPFEIACKLCGLS